MAAHQEEGRYDRSVLEEEKKKSQQAMEDEEHTYVLNAQEEEEEHAYDDRKTPRKKRKLHHAAFDLNHDSTTEQAQNNKKQGRRRLQQQQGQEHGKEMDDEQEGLTRQSSIRYITDPMTGERQRQGHLMVLLPLSRRITTTTSDESTSTTIQQQTRELIEFRVYVELSAFLAFKHIQKRSGAVLPELPRLLDKCDFTWTYRHHDTEFSPLQAATALCDYISETDRNTSSGNHPTTTSIHNLYGANNDTDNTMPDELLQEANNNATNITVVDVSDLQPDANITILAPTNVSIIVDDGISFSGELNAEIFDTRSDQYVSVYEEDTAPDQQEMPLPGTRKRRLLELENLLGNDNETSQQQPQQAQEQQLPLPPQLPFALMGAARSVVSQTLAILGNAYDLPQISSSSTASTLDDFRLFARTVPTNQGDAQAIIANLQQLGVSHVGVLFINDNWGRRYEQDVQFYAQRYNLTVHSVAYNDEDDLNSAMRQLDNFQVRYFIGIINPNSWRDVVRKAYQQGIMGHAQNQWFLGDLVELVGDNFVLDRETEWDLAQALHGTGVYFLKSNPHRGFDRAMTVFANSRQMQEEFLSLHAEPSLLENFTFSLTPGRSLFQYLTYDAVIALGLTACETPGLFSGQEFYDQLLKIDFKGVSGRVHLNGKTGTRLGDGLDYQIVNLVLKEAGDDNSTLSFHARESITINLPPQDHNGSISAYTETVSSESMPVIYVDRPFVYYDNTTTPPLVLPPVDENMNLIPDSARILCLTLAAFVMLFSIACGVWAHVNRHVYVVQAAQPIFLIQICVGTFLIAATIIPLSFQEPLPGLNIACAVFPWCGCLGFTVAIAALFSKAHRVNKLMNSGAAFRRVKVNPSDVVRPFLILLSINIALLIGWTASPWSLKWQRRYYLGGVDSFSRPVESYGMCVADDNMFLIFFVPLAVANVSIMVIATFESYKGRKLPSEFSETRYLAVAMVSLCETFTLGCKYMPQSENILASVYRVRLTLFSTISLHLLCLATTIVAVLDQPTAFFFVMTMIVCIACMSILLPVFVPKYLQRHAKEGTGRKTASLLSEHHGNNHTKSCGDYQWAVKPPTSCQNQSEFLSGVSSDDPSSAKQLLAKHANEFLASRPQPIIRHDSGESGPKKRQSSESQQTGSTRSGLFSSGGSSRITFGSSSRFGSGRFSFNANANQKQWRSSTNLRGTNYNIGDIIDDNEDIDNGNSNKKNILDSSEDPELLMASVFGNAANSEHEPMTTTTGVAVGRATLLPHQLSFINEADSMVESTEFDDVPPIAERNDDVLCSLTEGVNEHLKAPDTMLCTLTEGENDHLKGPGMISQQFAESKSFSDSISDHHGSVGKDNHRKDNETKEEEGTQGKDAATVELRGA